MGIAAAQDGNFSSDKAADVDDSMQDVKLRNAFSLCHVLRMHAPETPYSTIILEVSCTSAHSVIPSFKAHPKEEVRRVDEALQMM